MAINFTFSQTWTARYAQVIGSTEKIIEFEPPNNNPRRPRKIRIPRRLPNQKRPRRPMVGDLYDHDRLRVESGELRTSSATIAFCGCGDTKLPG